MKLNISDSLKLPIEAVTETFLVLGQRGGGKTNTSAVIAEELYRVGAPVCVLTPIDNWYGLKSSSDGAGPGLPFYMFGGPHGDLPLQPGAGAVMADVLIEQRISCVCCTAGFSNAERAAFVTALAERLLAKNRLPLHIIVEEADAFIPQQPMPDEKRMLGAMDRLIRWGRSPSGIGGTFISQRSAKINKDVTTQCSVLVAHRTMAEQDVDAIKGWFKYHPDKEKQTQLLGEIGALPKGTAYLYSPAWLDFFGKVPIRRRDTFDSASTPKLGAVKVEPKQLAAVDLKVLEKKMAETIAKVKADDPKELKARIAELEASAKGKGGAVDPDQKRKLEEQAYERGRRSTLDEIKRLQGQLSQPQKIVQRVHSLTKIEEWANSPTVLNESPTALPKDETRLHRNQSRAHERRVSENGGVDASLAGGERNILIAIAQNGTADRAKISVLTGYKRSSRDVFIGRLGSKGFVEIQGTGVVAVTPSGIAALGDDYEALPTGLALQSYWLERLSGGEKAILQHVIDAYPDPVDRELLTERTGYQRSSRDVFIGRLSARKLLSVPGRGQVIASSSLF